MLYLHKDFRLKIIHQYLKVSNVLLDINEMNLKIYDFAMEMIFSSNKGEANTTWIVAISIQIFLIGSLRIVFQKN